MPDLQIRNVLSESLICRHLECHHQNTKIPATNRFPKVQNAAMNDSIEPRFDFG